MLKFISGIANAVLNMFSTETQEVEEHLYHEYNVLINNCTHEYCIPYSKVRGLDKVIAYILVGLMFSSLEQRDEADRLVREAVVKAKNNEVIVIPTSHGTCTIRLTFQHMYIG